MVVSHPQQLTMIFGNLLLWEFTPGEGNIWFVIVTDRWNVLDIGTWPLYTRHETKTSREDLVNKCQKFCLQLPWNLIYTVCTCSRDLDHTVMMTYIYITMRFVFVPQNMAINFSIQSKGNCCSTKKSISNQVMFTLIFFI